MAKEIITTVATITDATGSGEGSKVDTIGSRQHVGENARFFLSVTSLTGTAPTMDVDITCTIGGVDYVLGSFTQASGATTETITIANCPSGVKAEYTAGGTVTDFDAVVTCARF